MSVGPLPTHTPPNNTVAESHPDKSVRNAVKESLRPAYEQLVESGVVETWHDVKASLGLDKGQWSDRDKLQDPATTPNPWKTPEGGTSPYPDHAPKTATQMQMEREMSTMMREKLVDQMKPWLIGLVGLYIVGRLIRLVIRYVRWKMVRRNKRRVAHARHHGLRRTGSRSRSRSRSTRSQSVSTSSPKETG